MPTEAELAWAAGLFEGEGCITLCGEFDSPRLKLSMTDFDVIERFAGIVGEGNTCGQTFKNPKYKPQLCWYTGSKGVILRILNQLSPFFGVRRRERAAQVEARCLDAPFEGWDAAREPWDDAGYVNGEYYRSNKVS